MESLSDKSLSLLQALGIHVVAALVMLLGLQIPQPIELSGGAPLEAVMIDMSQMPATPPPSPAPRPAPAPPPPAQTAPPPPPTPQPQVLDEQAAARQSQLATEQAAATERLRVQQIERERQRDEQQRELEEVRRERERAESDRRAEQQRMEQFKERQDAEAETRRAAAAATAAQQAAASAAASRSDSLLNEYQVLITTVVTQSWRRPPNTPAGIRCVLRVRQIPGGEVIGVTIGTPCNATGAIQQSILDAVERASPLPYSGFERVFVRDLNFTFVYNG